MPQPARTSCFCCKHCFPYCVKRREPTHPYQFLSAAASLVTNIDDMRFKFQTGSLGAAQRWWVLVSFSRLDRHKRDERGNPREEQPGLSEMSVCVGHFLLTSAPLVTAVLPARDIPRLDFLPFCLGPWAPQGHCAGVYINVTVKKDNSEWICPIKDQKCIEGWSQTTVRGLQ